MTQVDNKRGCIRGGFFDEVIGPAFAEKHPQHQIIPILNLVDDKASSERWLVNHIRRWLPCLAMDRAIAERRPTRARMVLLLQKLCKSIESASVQIENVTLRTYLNRPEDPFDFLPFQSSVNDVHLRLRSALSDPDLVSETGSVKRGGSKALPAGGCSAKDEIAAFVAELFRFRLGKEVSPRNKQICEAAQLVWEATGASRSGWGSNRLTGWRQHFQNAKKPKLQAFREQLHYQLVAYQGFYGEPAAA